MEKRQISNKIKIMSLLLITIFTICVMFTNKNVLLVNGEISEKTIGWGIKRANNHEQPDVGTTNKQILEENGGICLGNSEKKYIYLTFDEGYEAGYTAKILDILKENDVKATFFITAHYLNTEEDLVKRMIDEGHIVGNHTPISLMSGNDIKIRC